jgi:hypothetical protein
MDNKASLAPVPNAHASIVMEGQGRLTETVAGEKYKKFPWLLQNNI